MARWAEKLPSTAEKEVCDGTPDESFAICCGKGSLRWYAGRIICHPLWKRKFAMVRWAEKLPSTAEKEVCDGTPDESFAIR
ncbi:MAG: hypothetical protein LKG53_03305 [Lachnospiraceae bacterium]|nr:hypothetical protein [Lachnospiraceae bacterium]